LKYADFLRTKARENTESGFDYDRAKLPPMLFEWQKDIVVWALKKGRCALFEDCGMGKTPQQLAWAQAVSDREARPVLILAPLAVSEQTKREGQKFGVTVAVCRDQSDVRSGVNITNYEMLSHFDPSAFVGVVLDESSILKHHDSRTRGEVTDSFRDTPYRLCCTATPAPNDHMELCNHAEFLGVMNRTEMLSMFFIHDGGDTAKWRLKGHARTAFWRWMSTWALTITAPSDIGYPDDGFSLPPLTFHEIVTECDAGETDDGQLMLIPGIAQSLIDRRRARRNSLDERCEAAAAIANADLSQCLIWCDLNDESAALARMIDGAVEVRGSDSREDKAERLTGFSAQRHRALVSKPSIAGFGMNWQNCHRMIFVGLSDSYEMFYQAVRRCWRFGQTSPVDVYIIISEEEGAVKANIDRKEADARVMTTEMTRHARASIDGVLRANPNQRDEYNPNVDMIIPDWVVTEYESA
jgi:hypothetical protein